MRDLQRGAFEDMDNLPEIGRQFRLGRFPDVLSNSPRFIPDYGEFPGTFIPRNSPRWNFIPSYGPSRPAQPYLPPTFNGNDGGFVPETPEPKDVATEVDDLNRMPEDGDRVVTTKWDNGEGDSVDRDVISVDSLGNQISPPRPPTVFFS